MDEHKRIPRVELPDDVRLDTLAVREGLPASAWGENSEALFLTSSFRQPDAATAAARFANEEEAFIYSRFTNPTVMMFERRLAALEGAEACIATSSGMSAILLLGMGLRQFSMHPSQLLEVKREVLRCDCGDIAPRVLKLLRSDDPLRIREQLERINLGSSSLQ